jgi:hypothetical protein
MASEGVNLLAGCDESGRVRLYEVLDAVLYTVNNPQWVRILDSIGAEMGEMLSVQLSRMPPVDGGGTNGD